MAKAEVKLLDENGRRVDGRAWNEMRPVRMSVGVLERADGSALVEYGNTKVLAAVFGPRELHPRHEALPDRALLRCWYRMAAFAGTERKTKPVTRREIELSLVVQSALEPAVLLERFPKCAIDVYCLVLSADGGTRTCAITAASLALADAGIPMRGLVAAVAVGRYGDHILVDLNEVEDGACDSDMPVAFLWPQGEITLLQADGTMSPAMFERALEIAREVTRQIYEMMVRTLKERAVRARPRPVI